MPLRGSLRRLLGVTITAVALVLVLQTTASAQVTIDPTVTPTRNDGGWVYTMAILIFAIGVIITLLIVLGYMRFAPRFTRAEEGAPKTSRAEPIVPGREPPRRPVNIIGAPIVVPAPVAVSAPASVGAAASPAPARAAAATAPAETPAEAPARQAEPEAEPEAPAPEAPAAPAPAPAGERPEVPLDQETFDRVLAELLDKGTDRRVAEGQARRAALIAARKKAGG